MIGKGRSKNLWQGVQTSNFFSPLHMFLMLRGQGVRCLASLHCFYKVSKYQMKGVHNHPFMTAFSVLKHSSVVDPGEAPPYVYTKPRPEGLKKKIGGRPPPPPSPPLPLGLDDRAGSATAYSIGFNLGGSLDPLPRSATD